MGWMRFVPDRRGNYLIPQIVISLGLKEDITFVRTDKFSDLVTISVDKLAEDLSKEELFAWTEDSHTKDPDNKMIVIPQQEIQRRYVGVV